MWLLHEMKNLKITLTYKCVTLPWKLYKASKDVWLLCKAN